MTNEDLVPFWTTSAQVVPVLALAIVIEARAIGRQFSKKKNFAKERARRTWGRLYLVLALLLLISMFIALFKLASPDSPREVVSAATRSSVVIVAVGIAAGLLFAFSLPITRINNGLIATAGPALWERLPWSKLRRMQHTYRAVRQRVEEDIRWAKDQKHELLMSSVDIVFGFSDLDGDVDSLKALINDASKTSSQVLEAKRALREVEDLRLRFEAEYVHSLEVLEMTNERIRRLEEDYLPVIAGIIAGTTPEFEQLQLEAFRRSLAEVSRA